MRFTYCLVLTFMLFAGSWSAWYAASRTPNRQLSQFDSAAASQAAQPGGGPRYPRPLELIRAEPPNEAARPEEAHNSGSATSHRPIQEPVAIGKSNRSGAHGVAVQELEVVVEPGTFGANLLDILFRESCAVVALKVEDMRIIDAFLPGTSGRLERITGSTASERMDAFLAQHPCQRQFWVRWHDLDSPIGKEALRALDRYRLSPQDYYVYLVVGEDLSQQIQRAIEAAADRKALATEMVAYAKVLLREDDDGFQPIVLDLAQRSDQEREDRSALAPDVARITPPSAS